MEFHTLQRGGRPPGVPSANVPATGRTGGPTAAKEFSASRPPTYSEGSGLAGGEIDGVLCIGWGTCTLFFLAILAVLGIWFRRSRATAEGVGELTSDKQD